MLRVVVGVVLGAAIIAFPTAAAGQTELSVIAGPSGYDLSGTGTAFALNGAVAWRPFGRGVVIEPNIGFFRYTDQLDSRSTWLFPEIGLQGETRLGVARPYLGVGAGIGRERRDGHTLTDPTLHAALGARLPLAGLWGLRGEIRVRLVDPSHGSTVDFGLGIRRVLH